MGNIKKVSLNHRDFNTVKEKDIISVKHLKDFKLGDYLELILDNNKSSKPLMLINASVISIELDDNGYYNLIVQKWNLVQNISKSFFSNEKREVLHYIYVSSDEYYQITESKFIDGCSYDRGFSVGEEVELVNAYAETRTVEHFKIKGIHFNHDNNDKVNLTFL